MAVLRRGDIPIVTEFVIVVPLKLRANDYDAPCLPHKANSGYQVMVWMGNQFITREVEDTLEEAMRKANKLNHQIKGLRR